MIQELKSHKIAYSLLAVALLGFVIIYLHAWPDTSKQKIVVIAMGMFYFCWGIIVHKQMNHINSKVVFEYFAMALLAVSLLLLLLN